MAPRTDATGRYRAFRAEGPTHPEFWDTIGLERWKEYVDRLLLWASGTKPLLHYEHFRAFRDRSEDYKLDAEAYAKGGKVAFQYKHSDYSSMSSARKTQVSNLIADLTISVKYKQLRRPRMSPRDVAARAAWIDVRHYVGVTNVDLKPKVAQEVTRGLRAAVRRTGIRTYLLTAQELRLLATHPRFLWYLLPRTEQPLACFLPIEQVLEYEGSHTEPQWFREEHDFRPVGIDFGRVPPYFERAATSATHVPASWQKILEALEGDKDVLWLIQPASTGKTALALWLGYSWDAKHADWAVLYVDARQHQPGEQTLRSLRNDLLRARAVPIFLIFDNIHAWRDSTVALLEALPIPKGSKCAFLARPESGIENLRERHRSRYADRLIEPDFKLEGYAKGVMRSYLRRARTDLGENVPSLVHALWKLFPHDLIAMYYAVRTLRPGKSVSEDLAVDGYFDRIRKEILQNSSCPSPEQTFTALMAAGALYCLELPMREDFIVNHLNIEQRVVNWLVDTPWLVRELLYVENEGRVAHLRFPHESAARIFVRMCELKAPQLPTRRLAGLRERCQRLSIAWRNGLLAEYKANAQLEFRDLNFRGLAGSLPEVLAECIVYLRDSYPDRREVLAELLMDRGSAARGRGGPEDLNVAEACFEEARGLFGDSPVLGPLTKGRLLYEIGMLKFNRNDHSAFEELQEASRVEREIGREDGELVGEAQSWVVFSRLLPSRDRLFKAREKLLALLASFEQRVKVLSAETLGVGVGKARDFLQRWISSCEAHIAEASVDLDDAADVRRRLRLARRIRVELSHAPVIPAPDFIEGKYFLSRRPEWARKLLLKAAAHYEERRTEERVTEVWVALGDACKALHRWSEAKHWYDKASRHPGFGANAVGKKWGEERLIRLEVEKA